MGRLPKFFRVGSRLVLEILPSIAATVIGGYLLAQLHFGRASEPSSPAQIAATTTEQPTIGQDRAAMSEVLKVRRETPEAPAQVRPIATSVLANVPPPSPAAPAVTAAIPVGMDSVSPREPVARPATAPTRAAAAVAAPSPAAPHPDAEDEVYVPAPPPGLPPAPARDVDAPTVIVPSVAAETPAAPAAAPNAPAVAPAQPAHHGPVGAVFSTVSSFVGNAANATGHTVNWVIDLPGKAISAGGRVIGVSPPPPPPPERPFS